MTNVTSERINISKALSSDAYKAMYALEHYIQKSSLEHSLLHLIRTRASMLNGCAYCLDMHTKDARAAGESEQRLYGLAAWKETPYYNERERAALLWTDAVTLVSETHVPDEVYEQVRAHFNEQELIDLTLAVIAINSWNRLVISTRVTPGSYQPAQNVATAQGK
jgi:AhpD family alkylhydroperoxidase